MSGMGAHHRVSTAAAGHNHSGGNTGVMYTRAYLLHGWAVSGVLTSHHAPFPVFPRTCVSTGANRYCTTHVCMHAFKTHRPRWSWEEWKMHNITRIKAGILRYHLSSQLLLTQLLVAGPRRQTPMHRGNLWGGMIRTRWQHFVTPLATTILLRAREWI